MASSSVRRRPAFGTDMQFNTDSGKGDHCDESTSFRAAADTGRRRQQSSPPIIHGSIWLLIFSFFAAILLCVHAVFHTLPLAVTIDNASAGQFVEERARKTLNELSAFGARPVGSKANEELTVDYLVNEVTQLRRQMNVDQHSLNVDVQRVSGSFSLEYRGHQVNCYDNVNNVIVKLCPKHGSNDSLLINCHYDSAINATGIYYCSLADSRLDQKTTFCVDAVRVCAARW